MYDCLVSRCICLMVGMGIEYAAALPPASEQQTSRQQGTILYTHVCVRGGGGGGRGGCKGQEGISAGLQQQALEAPVVGLPHGSGDAHVRGDARQHQVLHPPHP